MLLLAAIQISRFRFFLMIILLLMLMLVFLLMMMFLLILMLMFSLIGRTCDVATGSTTDV